jgi:GT2 family glycosyltransferase
LTPSTIPPPENQSPRVSVVVVSHNRAALLRRCLESLEHTEGRSAIQVIVVDNGSTDGSARLTADFPNLQWVTLPKNFGLTKAMNLGWRAANAPYVYFLHDDTEVEPLGILKLADVLDSNPEAAAVCPLLVDEQGNPAPQLGTLPPTGEWRAAQPTGDDLVPVEYPRGAALMIRVQNIRAIRQIDERYGQFGADADLSAQIRRAGRKILLVPAAHVRHHGSEGYSSLERADFQQSRAVFLGKYQGASAGFKARAAAILGALAGGRFGELKHTLGGRKIDGT